MDSQGTKYCQIIRELSKEKRLKWVKENQDSTFKSVVFTDETPVQMETHRRTRVVKPFPTITSSDVGMVLCVSQTHLCLHGNIDWQENVRNKEGYHSMETHRRTCCYKRGCKPHFKPKPVKLHVWAGISNCDRSRLSH